MQYTHSSSRAKEIFVKKKKKMECFSFINYKLFYKAIIEGNSQSNGVGLRTQRQNLQ